MVHRDYFRHDFEGGGGRESLWASFWRTNPGTKAIIVGLVAIHLVMEFWAAADYSSWLATRSFLALSPEDVLGGYFWQLVTCALLHAHGDIWHLAFNCLGIFIFGRLVEQRLGVRRFLYFCLGSTVTASLGYLLWAVIFGIQSSAIGASGLDFGLIVLGAFWYPRLTVLIMFVIPCPLWALAAILIVLNLLGALSTQGAVANAAHLGGAFYGFLYYRYGAVFTRLFGGVDRMAAKRQRKKQHRRERDEEGLRAEVDRILDKVNREGMPSLTEEESRFLKQASKRLRR